MNSAHPMNDVADRISELAARAPDGVTVDSPLEAESGCWEAFADGWLLIAADPSEFAAQLEAMLAP